MDDVLDDSPDVSVLLGKVQRPELGRVLPVVGVGLEDPAGFTLVPDNSLLYGNPSIVHTASIHNCRCGGD